jgi:nicotinamidase-related amidase
MKNTVLMVVDVQTELVDSHPYNEDIVINNIQKLLLTARLNGMEVIYIRHDDGEGSGFCKGFEGWEIHPSVKPEPNEKIFDKNFSSAFRKTPLQEYLNSKKIETIILTGMQTEYCMDATCKVAFEYGYQVIVPKDTNTTFDNDKFSGKDLVEFYNETIWDNRFATLLPMDEVIKLFQ